MLTGVLHEGLLRQRPEALLEILANGEELAHARRHGCVGLPSSVLPSLRGSQPLAARVEQRGAEQHFGDLRRPAHHEAVPPPAARAESRCGDRAFPHRDRELLQRSALRRIASKCARTDAEPATLVLLQGLVQNEGDGWQWTLEELDRYYESTASVKSPAAPAGTAESDDSASPEAREHAGIYLDAAAMLGRRTAEMHLALASGRDAAFAPHTPGPERS